MAQAETVVARRAETREDMQAIYEFLSKRERLPARINPAKAQSAIATAVRADLAIMVEADGVIVASAGFIRAPWWFSDEEAFFSIWFHAAAEHRYPKVLRALMDEIYELVVGEDVPAFIHHRPERQSAATLQQFSADFAIYPSGRELQLKPRGEA